MLVAAWDARAYGQRQGAMECQGELLTFVTNDTPFPVDVGGNSISAGSRVSFVVPSGSKPMSAVFLNPTELRGGPNNTADLRNVKIRQECTGTRVALSPRDAVRWTVGGASVMVEYGRPSRRGRAIWGELVPWEKVWRLGADRATELTTTAGLRIGDFALPAGHYSLWMLPSESGESMLVINRQTNILGSRYRTSHDVVRLPLLRSSQNPEVERLTIAIETDRLWIRWGGFAWSLGVVGSSE